MSKRTEPANVSTVTGEAIIALLDLPIGEYDRVQTLVGTKSAFGLALTIERVINDPKFAKDIVRGDV